jgi:hypothetical protein
VQVLLTEPVLLPELLTPALMIQAVAELPH